MKKVGILSMQRIKNYGSFLQAYALKEIIESFGYHVEFVDYHVEKPLLLAEHNNKLIKVLDIFFGNGKIAHKIRYIKHKRKFFKNNANRLNLTEQYNYNPTLDTLVIGSDEVFNCIQKNTNVGYSLELFGKNNNANRLISYAASFGNTTLEKLKEYKKVDEISYFLNKFNSISVRDENSAYIVRNLSSIIPIYNLDPVLIYDYSNCSYIPKITTNEKYMILYAYNNRISKNEAKEIHKYCQQKKVKIYTIGGVQPFADKFINCSPFEVLAYFKNAEFIITDTFHGSIFSIINNKPFVTLVRKTVGNGYGNEEKLTDLLKRLNLSNQIIYDINELNDDKFNDINYLITNQKILDERNKAINYLRENI